MYCNYEGIAFCEPLRTSHSLCLSPSIRYPSPSELYIFKPLLARMLSFLTLISDFPCRCWVSPHWTHTARDSDHQPSPVVLWYSLGTVLDVAFLPEIQALCKAQLFLSATVCVRPSFVVTLHQSQRFPALCLLLTTSWQQRQLGSLAFCLLYR